MRVERLLLFVIFVIIIVIYDDCLVKCEFCTLCDVTINIYLFLIILKSIFYSSWKRKKNKNSLEYPLLST